MKAMVLAAGLGERMRPLTDDLPKPLLPIANRPVMCYILEHLARHGFTDVVANLHYRGQEIIDYFGDGSCCGVDLSYAHEEKLWGIAGGVRRCREFFGDETFLVIGADDLTDMDLSALVREHRRVGAVSSIGLTEVEETAQFGIVVTDGEGRIDRFVEKPKSDPPSHTANTQIYLFEPKIFDFIPPDTVYDFGRDAFPALVASDLPFYGFRLPGYWRDIGSISDYLCAQWDLMEGRVKGVIAEAEMEAGIWRGSGCELHPDARVEAPVVLGSGCVVHAGASLGGATVIGDGAEIGAGSQLRNTVVWGQAKVPTGIKLSGAVVNARGIFRG